MFLGRPLFVFARFPDQDVVISAADYLFQTGGRASQTYAQVRMLLHRKGEIKLPFKPNWRSIHGCQITSSYKMPKHAGATQFVERFRAIGTYPAGVASILPNRGLLIFWERNS